MPLENQMPRIEELWAMVDAGVLTQAGFERTMQQRQDEVYKSCGQEPPRTYQHRPLNGHVLS